MIIIHGTDERINIRAYRKGPSWAALLRSNSEDLSVIMTSEQGKPIKESLGEIEYAANFLDWFAAETGLGQDAATQALAYLAEGRRALGVIPTQKTLVLESRTEILELGSL